MNDLYTALISAKTEYLENGEVRSNPPNSLQLRAARAIKMLSEEQQGFTRAYTQLEAHYVSALQELNELKAKNEQTTQAPTPEAITE